MKKDAGRFDKRIYFSLCAMWYLIFLVASIGIEELNILINLLVFPILVITFGSAVGFIVSSVCLFIYNSINPKKTIAISIYRKMSVG